jgi:hypothetical protein
VRNQTLCKWVFGVLVKIIWVHMSSRAGAHSVRLKVSFGEKFHIWHCAHPPSENIERYVVLSVAKSPLLNLPSPTTPPNPLFSGTLVTPATSGPSSGSDVSSVKTEARDVVKIHWCVNGRHCIKHSLERCACVGISQINQRVRSCPSGHTGFADTINGYRVQTLVAIKLLILCSVKLMQVHATQSIKAQRCFT